MELEQKVADAIRKSLLKREAVRIDGLGTLRTMHTPAREDRSPNGEIRLLPPVISIVFEGGQ